MNPAEHPQHLDEADGPYFVRWGLGSMLRLASVCGLCVLLVLGVALAAGEPVLLGLLAPVLATLAVGILFYRNPRRKPPEEADCLVSPADGRVVEVSEVVETQYVAAPCWKLGIFLSIFNVHVNRSPGDARVEYLKYRPGAFLDARDARCAVENESQSIGMALRCPVGEGGDRVLVRQISGAVARRIICPLREGDGVRRGGLIGMIRYGSRTELYVARSDDGKGGGWAPAVRVGDSVRAGESILFRRRSKPPKGVT